MVQSQRYFKWISFKKNTLLTIAMKFLTLQYKNVLNFYIVDGINQSLLQFILKYDDKFLFDQSSNSVSLKHYATAGSSAPSNQNKEKVTVSDHTQTLSESAKTSRYTIQSSILPLGVYSKWGHSIFVQAPISAPPSLCTRSLYFCPGPPLCPHP